MIPNSKTGLVLAALVALLAPAGRSLAAGLPEGKSCADCCKLPCIEAQLWEANYMKNRYQSLAKTKGLTAEKYLQREEEFRTVAQAMRAIYTGQNPNCNMFLPASEIEGRGLYNQYGYINRWQGGQLTSITFNLVTDPEKCELTRPGASELAPRVHACTGMGEAIVAHEQKHIDECNQRVAAAKRTGRPPSPLTPAQNARAEVNGYQAEIEQLEKSRREAAAPCMKSSCALQAAFNRTARAFGTDIRKLLGIAKKRAPSNSPLGRAARKG